MIGAKIPGRFSKPDDSEFITVRGQKVHLSQATFFIKRLADCRDDGLPVIFQDTKQKLNTVETPPEEVQQILEEAIDALTGWLEQKRTAP